MKNRNSMDVTIVGGGMITEVQILPSVFQLQRMKTVNDISICALNSQPFKKIAGNESLRRAFPDQSFTSFPDYREVAQDENFPDLYKKVIVSMRPRNIVVIALPDQMHYKSVLFALEHDQHILSVKPLTLNYNQAHEIEKLAFQRGCL